VAPGLAYDCFGRELVLAEQTTRPVPSDDVPDGGYVLLISYREERPRTGPGRSGACRPGAVSRVPGVDLAWHPARGVSMRDGVPLARMTADGELQTDYWAPRARRASRPRIGSGATVRGETPWVGWRAKLSSEREVFLGLQVTVDTAAAGFAGVPCYFAWMPHGLWDRGIARLLDSVPKPVMSLSHTTTSDSRTFFQALALTHGHIANPAATHFTYRLWMPGLDVIKHVPLLKYALLAHARRYPAFWLGIECE
jgi:hypothetical protein